MRSALKSERGHLARKARGAPQSIRLNSASNLQDRFEARRAFNGGQDVRAPGEKVLFILQNRFGVLRKSHKLKPEKV